MSRSRSRGRTELRVDRVVGTSSGLAPEGTQTAISLTWPGVSGFDVSESKRTVCEPA